MKSHYQVLSLLLLIASYSFATTEEVAIGREQIKSNKFPKISFAADYSVFRHGAFLGEKGIKSAIKPAFGGAMFFDVGVMKYLNAGAGFSATVGDVRNDSEPIHLRFTLFAKPIIPLNDQLAFFARIGGGLSLMVINPIHHFGTIGTEELRRDMQERFGSQQYSEFSPGLNGLATIGVEYFPFSRFGVAFEWGVRTDLYYSQKSSLLENITKMKFSDAKAPSSIKYLGFDMPLSLTVHVIL